MTSRALSPALVLALALSAAACGADADAAIGLEAIDGGVTLELGGGDAVGGDTATGVCRDDLDCEGAFELAPCRVARCREDGTCAVAEAPAGTACEDGDACTVGEACEAGACVGGVARACDDDDLCTADSCEPDTGCVHQATTCPGGDSPCDVGVCDPATGACGVETLADGEPCDDGLACTAGSTCQDGACVGFVSDACDDDNVCTVDLCTAEGCAHNPASGVCDDGDPCTHDDRCDDGTCAGTLMACDDGDPCTVDACDGGQCAFTPIPDCEPPLGGCEDAAYGAPCDDGDPSTVADLCLADGCAGFALTRISSAQEGRRFTRVGRDGDAWFAAMEIDGASDGAEGALAEVGLAGTALVLAETRHGAPFSALHGPLATDLDGALWERGTASWTDSGPLAAALAALEPGVAWALWSYVPDGGGLLAWLVGEGAFGGPWIRRCAVTAGGDASCVSQSLVAADSPVPRAVTGSVACDVAGCSPSLVLAADLFESTGPDGVPRYFNDVYGNSGGVASVWQVAAFDPGPSKATSRDLAALAPGLYLTVGGYGYMRENTPLGDWGDQLTVTQDQADLHFEGAWAGAGGTLVVGWREEGAGRELVVMAAPQLGDPASPSAWRRHMLGVELGDDGGLFDVWGDESGDVVIVGGGRLDANTPAEALVFVRRAVAGP